MESGTADKADDDEQTVSTCFRTSPDTKQLFDRIIMAKKGAGDLPLYYTRTDVLVRLVKHWMEINTEYIEEDFARSDWQPPGEQDLDEPIDEELLEELDV